MTCQYIIIHKLIQIPVYGLQLNLIKYEILNLSAMIGEIMRHWIIAINDPLVYKNTPGPL